MLVDSGKSDKGLEVVSLGSGGCESDASGLRVRFENLVVVETLAGGGVDKASGGVGVSGELVKVLLSEVMKLTRGVEGWWGGRVGRGERVGERDLGMSGLVGEAEAGSDAGGALGGGEF